MTTIALKLILKRELSKVNKEIDEKIVRGESYQKEARLHKKLFSHIQKLNSKRSLLSLL